MTWLPWFQEVSEVGPGYGAVPDPAALTFSSVAAARRTGSLAMPPPGSLAVRGGSLAGHRGRRFLAAVAGVRWSGYPVQLGEGVPALQSARGRWVLEGALPSPATGQRPSVAGGALAWSGRQPRARLASWIQVRSGPLQVLGYPPGFERPLPKVFLATRAPVIAERRIAVRVTLD